MTSNIAVVGAGIIGLTVAREIARREPTARITVLEKERDLAQHQTGRNSGVIHSGIYYAPGSLKATLCRRGGQLLRAYCQANDIAVRECGKVIIAVDQSELPRMRDLYSRGVDNGIDDLRLIGPDELRQIEPNATGVAALHLPHTAICDYRAVLRQLKADIVAAGHHILTGAAVRGVRSAQGRVQLSVAGDSSALTFDRVVGCAGLQSDRLLRGEDAGARGERVRIIPFRGDYYVLRPQRSGLVRGLIYPVPDPRYPFLGIHLTPRIDGSVLIGPNALLALAREGYGRASFNARDSWATLSWPGFWKMASHNWRTGVEELGYSLSRRRFVERAKRYVPALTPADVVRGPAGMRAQAVDRNGALVDDFRIVVQGNVTTVVNAPSPGATSSFAIAEAISDRL